MYGKEFVLDCIRTFFTVVVLINVVMFLLGLYFMPEAQFGYEAFAVPLIYGFVGTLPNVVMYSRRELKIGELIVRKVIQIILIEVLVLFVAFYDTAEQMIEQEIITSTAVSILVIYVLATFFDWLQNYLAAKQITEELQRFQERVQE